jgi:hypothetical protein
VTLARRYTLARLPVFTKVNQSMRCACLMVFLLGMRTICSQSASNSTGVPYIRGRFDFSVPLLVRVAADDKRSLSQVAY